MPFGPEPTSHRTRLALAQDITTRLRERYAGDLLAVGAYGSLARGTDGPYSDVEILAVLHTPDADHTYEWTHGPWKAEVDIRGRDTVLREAAEVEGRWPLTHGAFVHLLPLHDPDAFLPDLRHTALSQPDGRFAQAMRDVIVGELYEWIGKLRNARHAAHAAPLPELAVNLAKYTAFLIGLSNRTLYTTGSRVLEESLALPARPEGYDALCHMAMDGALMDSDAVAQACEQLWIGVLAWAEARGLAVVESQRIPF